MRDRFSGDTRQIQEFRALIDQGLKTLTMRRQMMSRKVRRTSLILPNFFRFLT
jgi:hypothetical protein